MELSNYSPKQIEVLRSFAEDNPKILICSGAKRAGKTFILIKIFLAHVSLFRNKGLSFIIGGTTQASIKRNILNDLEKIIGREIRFKDDGHFSLYGNKIYCFHGANADSFKAMRGFTSAGALLNEATTLHDSFIKEAVSRCSYKGARIFMDTNPENPTHTVKTDYIDKDGQRLKNGQLNIKAFNFTLFDNVFLNDEYIESIVASTPTGMFTDRDIYGIWVSAEGVVYKDFDKDVHYITNNKFNEAKIVRYFAGVDWGYKHYGSIVVMAKDANDNYYVVKEYSATGKEIDYWVEKAKEAKQMFGNITFYCDSARTEHIDRFRREGIRALCADKSRLAGIERVSSLLKQNKLFVIEENVSRFKTEIYNYVWSKDKDDTIKAYDDVLDAIRYAIYSECDKKMTKFDRNKYAL